MLSILSPNTTVAMELPQIDPPQFIEVKEVPQLSESIPAVAEVPTVRELVVKIAKEEGVNVAVALYVAEHESNFNEKAVGDMHIICPSGPYVGTKVYARGVFQLTRCYHPNVTDKQAFNAEFNVRYGIRLMKSTASCMKEFTTCRKYYGVGI